MSEDKKKFEGFEFFCSKRNRRNLNFLFIRYHEKYIDLIGKKVNLQDITTIPNWCFDVMKVSFSLLNQFDFWWNMWNWKFSFKSKIQATEKRRTWRWKNFREHFFAKKEQSNKFFKKHGVKNDKKSHQKTFANRQKHRFFKSFAKTIDKMSSQTMFSCFTKNLRNVKKIFYFFLFFKKIFFEIPIHRFWKHTVEQDTFSKSYESFFLEDLLI